MLDLSPSLQDYLETIFELSQTHSTVRVTDIALKLDIAKASVSQSVDRLKNLGLVTQESYGPIILTETGREQAIKIHQRHQALRSFLIKILKVDSKTAEEDACKMEHAISSETMDKLVVFLRATGLEKEEKMKTLANLKKGQGGTVTKIEAKGPLRRRIIEMGLTVGTFVTVIGVAPMGDPMELSLKGYRLSLRKEEAELIFVEVENNGTTT